MSRKLRVKTVTLNSIGDVQEISGTYNKEPTTDWAELGLERVL